MVIYGVYWLLLVDFIIVLIDGKIIEMGIYDEFLSYDGVFV